MSSKLVRNLEQNGKPVSRVQLSQLSGRSFIATDRPVKSRLETSFVNDPQNSKELQKIQKKAQELREKEKRERNYLKRLKKVYEQQLKQFQQLEKVTRMAIYMQNTQLKEERIQFCTLKDEKQILALKNQQLEEENKRINEQIRILQQNFKNLKVQFEQQSELLDKGIHENQIESQTAYAVPGSLLQVEQLSRDLEEQRRSQLETKAKKDEENLKIQTQQINNCNFMLQNLLKQIKKSQQERQKQDQDLQDKIQKSEHKLMSLTDQLMAKTQQLSKALTNAHKLEKDLKERQSQINSLKSQLQQKLSLIASKQQELLNTKQQLQINQDLQRFREETERQTRSKKAKNFEKFQQKLKKLFENKMLKQHSTVYDTFGNTANDIFRLWDNSSVEINDTADKFVQGAIKTIEASLIKLNDYFRQKAQKDIQRIQKMVQHIQNANTVIQKHADDEEYIERQQKDAFMMSSPDRFNTIAPVTQHKRQQSQTSAKSYKKSIVLEQDIDNAVNFNEDAEKFKEQILDMELSNLKDSQVILDSLNQEKGSEGSTIKDAISESSFNRSKISQLSHAEQEKHYNNNVKNAKLNAKLKKKKTVVPTDKKVQKK